MSNPKGKSKRPSLAGRVTSFLCGGGSAQKAPSPPPPPAAPSQPSIPMRRMYTHDNTHLPSVPASTIAASHPNASRISGWWNMYDDLTHGPQPSTSGFVDVDLEAGPVAGPSRQPPEPERETGRAHSRQGSVDSIDFFNGRVTGRAVEPKDKGKGKKKEGPERPARREGAGVFET